MNAYNKVDQQLHLLCQVIGKANRTYVPDEPDESHTNLYFDPSENKMLGRWIESALGNVLFSLDLNTLHFEVQDASRNRILTVSSIGKTMEEIEMEFETQLPIAGLDPTGFRAPMPHTIPEYPFSKNPVEAIDEKGYEHWKYYRNLANETCYSFLGYAQAYSEVRIWPEHFDTGIYFEHSRKIGIGFGLAMKDSMAGEPYFYMAGYPINIPLSFKDLPRSPMWKWELGEQWKGVILPLSLLDKASDSQTAKILSDYFMHNFDWFDRNS